MSSTTRMSQRATGPLSRPSWPGARATNDSASSAGASSTRSRANAALNGVELRYSQDFFGEADRFDLILEKATELGVARIRPVTTRRAVVDKLNAERARTVTVEAAEQCARTALPIVDAPDKLDTLLRENFCPRPLSTCYPVRVCIIICYNTYFRWTCHHINPNLSKNFFFG